MKCSSYIKNFIFWVPKANVLPFNFEITYITGFKGITPCNVSCVYATDLCHYVTACLINEKSINFVSFHFNRFSSLKYPMHQSLMHQRREIMTEQILCLLSVDFFKLSHYTSKLAQLRALSCESTLRRHWWHPLLHTHIFTHT